MKKKNNLTAEKTPLRKIEKSLRVELVRLEERLEKKFVTKFDLQETEERIDKNATKYKNEILTKLDGIIGEQETMREDRTIGAYQTSELREKAENHEKRITNLEHIQKTA